MSARARRRSSGRCWTGRTRRSPRWPAMRSRSWRMDDSRRVTDAVARALGEPEPEPEVSEAPVAPAPRPAPLPAPAPADLPVPDKAAVLARGGAAALLAAFVIPYPGLGLRGLEPVRRPLPVRGGSHRLRHLARRPRAAERTRLRLACGRSADRARGADDGRVARADQVLTRADQCRGDGAGRRRPRRRGRDPRRRRHLPAVVASQRDRRTARSGHAHARAGWRRPGVDRVVRPLRRLQLAVERGR